MATRPVFKNLEETLADLRTIVTRLRTASVTKKEKQDLQSQTLMVLHEIEQLNPKEEPSKIPSYGILGESEQVKKLLSFIQKAGPSDATVLITGENGTGKEGAAAAIHRASKRAKNKYSTLNCGALTETLLESELFGHVQGAFTGATFTKIGVFEQADQGTLFLDEIGDTTPAMQVKILRVLQEGTFTPVGGIREKKVDVRVVAATNKNLKEMVKQGTFREDLYYRINVLYMHIPPLRERPEDILLLANHFLDQLTKRNPQQRKYLTPNLQARLIAHRWPGNVRELQNQITQLHVLADGAATLKEEHLSADFFANDAIRFSPAKGFDFEKGLGRLTDEFEKSVVEAALNFYKFNYTKTANALQITTRGLTKIFIRLGIDPDPPSKSPETILGIKKVS